MTQPFDAPRRRLAGRRITLCVTGSVAAYKAVLALRLLLKEGAEIEVVLTRSGAEFVGAATFSALTGNSVHTDMFAAGIAGELHVDLAARSDCIVIMPATADVLARCAAGRADDVLTATVLCARCPVLCVPAMHPAMWEHPATQRNVATLAGDGRVEIVGPVAGEVASGDQGMGRMVEADVVVAAVVAKCCPGDLAGRRVVVSAGPTLEDLDPVRFIGNRSSGKMGFAIAERAAARGAEVTLVSGPVGLTTPAGVDRVDVRGALEMQEAIARALSGADLLVMAAAVGDFRPAEKLEVKLKRGESDALAVSLVQNPDILGDVARARRGDRPVLVGFALEADTDDKVMAYARDKLDKKRVDLMVANHAADSLGRDTNRATFVSREGNEALGELSKLALADRVLDWAADRLEALG
jgi:phosphopantothenoylcysteine decarboxylase/phosphopantothenate--cysteine ligase